MFGDETTLCSECRYSKKAGWGTYICNNPVSHNYGRKVDGDDDCEDGED